MARLDRLRVEGYKSIAKADLTLENLNVLIGANGAGKSNLIEALALLGSIVNGRLQLSVGRAGGASALLHRGSGRTESMVLNAAFETYGYDATLTPRPADELIFEQESVYFDGLGRSDAWTRRLGEGTKESELSRTEQQDPTLEFCREAMLSWQVFHFHDTSSSAGFKQKQPVDDNERLRPDGANLAPLLYRIERTHPDRFRWITDAIKLVAPFFGGFRLRPDRLNSDRMQLEWEQAGSTGYFNADSLSDGTLRFILLMTLLLQPDSPSLIIIDEPELGLHPFAITVLADALRSCATSQQLVVSTQSVTLLNQLDPEDLIVTENVEGSSTFHRPDWPALEAWLSEYSVGELWEKNLIGGRPR